MGVCVCEVDKSVTEEHWMQFYTKKKFTLTIFV